MRLKPLAGQPLAFGYLFASHPHIRAGLVSGGHATVPVTLTGVPHYPHAKGEGLLAPESCDPSSCRHPIDRSYYHVRHRQPRS